jgi:hypothetical protein
MTYIFFEAQSFLTDLAISDRQILFVVCHIQIKLLSIYIYILHLNIVNIIILKSIY